MAYDVDDVESVLRILPHSPQGEVEPLAVAQSVRVVLQKQVILVLVCLAERVGEVSALEPRVEQQVVTVRTLRTGFELEGLELGVGTFVVVDSPVEVDVHG